MTWWKTKQGTSWTLCCWQKMVGWLNWSFNVFPHLQPVLNTFYPKMAGKEQALMKIWVNNEVQQDLNWAMGHMQESLRIRLLTSIFWDSEDVDETIFCDACMLRMGFWFPAQCEGFYVPTPVDAV